MIRFGLLIPLGLLLLGGCATHKKEHDGDFAILRDLGSNELWLVITHREWEGLWGPEGYVGFRENHYAARLLGPGPVYLNPFFVDNPPGSCVGTISLDSEKNEVKVDMRRVIGGGDRGQKTKPHPANGSYTIKSRIKLSPEEREKWLRDWKTQQKPA